MLKTSRYFGHSVNVHRGKFRIGWFELADVVGVEVEEADLIALEDKDETLAVSGGYPAGGNIVHVEPSGDRRTPLRPTKAIPGSVMQEREQGTTMNDKWEWASVVDLIDIDVEEGDGVLSRVFEWRGVMDGGGGLMAAVAPHWVGFAVADDADDFSWWDEFWEVEGEREGEMEAEACVWSWDMKDVERLGAPVCEEDGIVGKENEITVSVVWDSQSLRRKS
jgi:hypothetical protein